MTDNPDPITVPRDLRMRALAAAEDAFDHVLTEAGVYVDFAGRMELLELALADAYASLGGDDPEPPVN